MLTVPESLNASTCFLNRTSTMKIRQLPSGSWTTQIQVNGKRKSITHKSKTECKRLAREYASRRSDTPCEQLGSLIDNYIDDKRNVLSPSTVERYERVRKHYFQRLMTVPAREITAERMQREINLMAVKYAPKTSETAGGFCPRRSERTGCRCLSPCRKRN